MKKFIFKKNKEKISDGEMQQQMNFDKFISGYTPPVQGWLTGGAKLYTILASTSAILLITGYLIFNSVKKDHSAQSFVNPPIHTLDIPVSTFVFNTNTDSTLIYTTGTMITIPSGAFMDAAGQSVMGEVQIHYREFHDPVDMILSGIPMNYDSAGVHYQLESAGMFEITATLNGQQVYIKPDKKLLVNMISHTNNPTDYNIYNLDTIRKRWDYVSENTSENKTCFAVFEDHANKNKPERVIYQEKPVRPKKANHFSENFSIDFNKDEFPELAAYKGLKFEPISGEKKYDAALSKKTWENVLIERHPDNEHYIITFSTQKESHCFTVLPVVDEKDFASATKNFELRQNEYEALLAKKGKDAIRKNDSLYRINALFKGIVLKNDLNQRFNNFIDDSYMETSKDLLAYRTFSVSKLGIWNSDKPIPFFATDFKTLKGDHIAQFISQDNQPLLLKNVYLVRRSVNGIYSISEKQFDHFPFYKDAIDIMIGITDENELVYLKDQELKETVINEKNILFKMKKTDAEIVTATQLKNLLKI